jgi:hypothetical protein
MLGRDKNPGKNLSESSATPVQTGLFRSRPFSDPTVSDEVSPHKQELPDLQTQLERGARFSQSLSRMKVYGNRPAIQPKIAVGAPGDKYEQEADRMAAQVMSMAAPVHSPSVQRQAAPEEEEVPTNPLEASITPLVQREVMPEEEEVQMKPLTTGTLQREAMPEDEEPVQTKPLANTLQREAMPEEEAQAKPSLQRATDGSLQAGGDVESRLNTTKGGGSPLPKDLQSFMQPRFGADFSKVRVHTGSEAVQMNRDLGAQAFTHGSDIYFGEGKAPAKDELTAHELTHVVQQTNGSVQRKFRDDWGVQNSSLDASTVPSIQRDGEESNLNRLNEMLDSFDVPEDEVITLCGQLTATEKAIVLAGGYRSRMAAALNVSEMVRAVNNLGPVLSTKLEWVQAAALTTSSIGYEDIAGMIRSAPQGERDVLKINYWKNFFVDVCTNETMVTALNDLGYDLQTKLNWLRAEMTVTSMELDYVRIKPWIIAAPQAERDALKTDAWKNFFVDVCTNETMVTALNDLGYDLQTKLNWLRAEMTVTSMELDYVRIKPWIIAAPQAERDALKTDAWKNFFVDVCTNETMVTALNDLGYDLQTKLNWLRAEMTVTSMELDYVRIKPWIIAAPQAERDALKTDAWKNFFVDVCTNETMVTALIDLNYDMETQVRWMIAESDKETVLNTATFMTRVRTAPNFTDLMKILVDVSALPAGKIQDAVAQLAGSELEIDRNTANHILEGDVTAYYTEDLQQPANVNAEVTAAGLNPTAFTVYLEPPDNTKKLFVQLNAIAFTNMDSSKIFCLRSNSLPTWKTLLVHETNHALNADAAHPGASFERYKGEFRAYWVAEYRNVADLNVRSQQIKAHILGGYPLLNNRYNADAAFKVQVDGHTSPDGNVTNE